MVLGASPQGAESHGRFALKHQLNFPLLVDEDLALATRYGAVKGPDEGKLRINRSTFIISPEGKIERSFYGVKAKGHVDDVKASLAP